MRVVERNWQIMRLSHQFVAYFIRQTVANSEVTLYARPSYNLAIYENVLLIIKFTKEGEREESVISVRPMNMDPSQVLR